MKKPIIATLAALSMAVVSVPAYAVDEEVVEPTPTASPTPTPTATPTPSPTYVYVPSPSSYVPPVYIPPAVVYNPPTTVYAPITNVINNYQQPQSFFTPSMLEYLWINLIRINAGLNNPTNIPAPTPTPTVSPTPTASVQARTGVQPPKKKNKRVKRTAR